MTKFNPKHYITTDKKTGGKVLNEEELRIKIASLTDEEKEQAMQALAQFAHKNIEHTIQEVTEEEFLIRIEDAERFMRNDPILKSVSPEVIEEFLEEQKQAILQQFREARLN
jgi:hypothetical protein